MHVHDCMCMSSVSVCLPYLYVMCIHVYIIIHVIHNTLHTCRLEMGGVSLCTSPYILGVQ